MNFDVNKDLEFRIAGQTPKTFVFHVWNTQTNCMLGAIKWYPAWRHYCYFQEPEIVMSDRCLIRIGEYVKQLNEDHKVKSIKQNLRKSIER